MLTEQHTALSLGRIPHLLPVSELGAQVCAQIDFRNLATAPMHDLVRVLDEAPDQITRAWLSGILWARLSTSAADVEAFRKHSQH